MDESEAVEIAGRIIAQSEPWADQACYNPYLRGDGWLEGVYEVSCGSDEKIKVGGRIRHGVCIDRDGKVLEYTRDSTKANPNSPVGTPVSVETPVNGKLLHRLTRAIAQLASPDEPEAIAAEHRLCRHADRLRRAGSWAIRPIMDACAHPNPRVRLRAAGALAATRAPGAFETVSALTCDPDSDVRYDCAMALGRFGDQQAIPLLIELTCQPRREDNLDSAAGMALGYLGRPALRSILPLLDADNLSSRELATWWLGRAGPRTMADLLSDQVHDPDPQVQVEATEALGAMGERLHEPRCLEILAEYLTDPDERLRELAEYWHQKVQQAVKSKLRRSRRW